MPNDELIKYVGEARAWGMSNEQITQELLKNGWQIRDFFNLILEHQSEKSSDDIIFVRDVSKKYGGLKALDDLNLNVKRGRVTAILGPNGAGKTTIIRILTTLLKPTAGQITIDGLDVVSDAESLRSIIGLAGQFATVDEMLTGRENLEMVGRLYHLDSSQAKDRASELIKQFDLEDAADRIARTYSGGMRRRLDLAASLVIKPRILFLDEPTSGLDPHGRFALWNIIRDLVEQGTTVLLTTQYLEEADQLAHQIFVIDHGRIIAQGTSDELKRQIGGDIIELHMTNHQDATRASLLIKQFGEREPQPDTHSGIVTMAVSGGTTILADIIRVIDSADLELSDIMLRRPSLDDVFIKLTGHQAI